MPSFSKGPNQWAYTGDFRRVPRYAFLIGGAAADREHIEVSTLMPFPEEGGSYTLPEGLKGAGSFMAGCSYEAVREFRSSRMKVPEHSARDMLPRWGAIRIRQGDKELQTKF